MCDTCMCVHVCGRIFTLWYVCLSGWFMMAVFAMFDERNGEREWEKKRRHANITAKSFSYSKSFISAFMRIFSLKTYIPIKMSVDLFHSSELRCVCFFHDCLTAHRKPKIVKESMSTETKNQTKSEKYLKSNQILFLSDIHSTVLH